MYLVKKIRDIYGLDERAIVLFKFFLGLVLLSDIALRAMMVDTIFTDEGILPRWVQVKSFTEVWRFDLFLATGNNIEEQEILNEIILNFEKYCIPLNNLSISNTLPIIKNCTISICNDTSFSHLSAALGIPTIVSMYSFYTISTPKFPFRST